MEPADVITVGVLTPHAAGGPRGEIECMVPAHVRVHVSRTAARAGGAEPPTDAAGLLASATPEALDRAVSALLPVEPDVLALASASSGYALGHDDETALVQRLAQRWGLPVCATSRSAVSALRSRLVERISLVHPPWFSRSLHELGGDYFRSQGFEVVQSELAELPDAPDRIEPSAVVDWVARHLDPRAEAVVLAGNGFRAARAVAELESRTGRLVLESNQVLLARILGTTGAPVPIRGFGRLFDERISGRGSAATCDLAPVGQPRRRDQHTRHEGRSCVM